jgi:hypothetical protein
MDDDPCLLGFAFVMNDGDALAVLSLLRSFNNVQAKLYLFFF